MTDFNEWKVQESCTQSGGGQQQSEEDICGHTSRALLGHNG